MGGAVSKMVELWEVEDRGRSQAIGEAKRRMGGTCSGGQQRSEGHLVVPRRRRTMWRRLGQSGGGSRGLVSGTR